MRHLCTLFSAMMDELRQQAGAIGLADLVAIVGRTEYLEQRRERDRVDCNALLTLIADDYTLKQTQDKATLRKKIRRPRTSLTREISTSILKQIDRGYREIIFDDNDVTNVDRAIGGTFSRRAGKTPSGEPGERNARH